MAKTIRVEVMAATGVAWEGDALSVVARTTEGDIGIRPDHEPLLAAMEPCAAEVLTVDGRREILALDVGFLSVADNRVSLLSQYARVAREIDVAEAEREFAAAAKRIEAGESDLETVRHYKRAKAQLKAAELAGTRH